MSWREPLLTIHLLAIIVWIGFGFFELWLGRIFMKSAGSSIEAPLIRMIYNADIVVFAATLIAFAAGTAMALLLDWGFFQTTWLGVKQAIMFAVLAVVLFILPTALKMGALIAALPDGPGPATPEIKALYARLEPWYFAMRVAALVAVVLAIWRPA